MTGQVEKATKHPEEKRLKVWTSRVFKTEAIEFYADWVALNSVCETYVEYIKDTQYLYRYITRQNVKKLAQTFLSNLCSDQKELAYKEFDGSERFR